VVILRNSATKGIISFGRGGMNIGWMVVLVFEPRISRKCRLKVFVTAGGGGGEV